METLAAVMYQGADAARCFTSQHCNLAQQMPPLDMDCFSVALGSVAAQQCLYLTVV